MVREGVCQPADALPRHGHVVGIGIFLDQNPVLLERFARGGLIAVGFFVLLVIADGELVPRVVPLRSARIAVQVVAIPESRFRVSGRAALAEVGIGHQDQGLPALRIVGISLEDEIQVFAPLVEFLSFEQRLALLEEHILGRVQQLQGDLVGLLRSGRAAGRRQQKKRDRHRRDQLQRGPCRVTLLQTVTPPRAAALSVAMAFLTSR